MKDSPNGKRYGHRGRGARIVEAYGFDLSPRATPSWCRWPRRRGAERLEIGRLRRRAPVALLMPADAVTYGNRVCPAWSV